MDQIEELLTRGVANIIPGKAELEKVLKAGKKLNIFLGIDPTATNIHLGHAVPLRKLQHFAELGHNVKFLIGDFTALIGDTSDKESERPVLTSEQIHENFQTYKKQAEKLLDFSKVTVVHNSDWLKKLTFEEIVKLCQHFSFGDFASRELIKKRLTAGKYVGLHEALYPVMQGYDSYFMDTDIQLGGTDQTFNMQAGRALQKDLRNKESFVMTNVFLSGTDGRKMSKTWGNAIWLTEEPNDMFAKVMAIDDSVIVEYFTLGTNLPMKKIKEVEEDLKGDGNPMMAKKELARQIVKELHGEQLAKTAEDHFERTVQKKEMPSEVPTVEYNGESLVDFLVDIDLASSKSDARRLIEQGGVEIDNERIDSATEKIELQDGAILKVGKRKFVKIKNSH